MAEAVHPSSRRPDANPGAGTDHRPSALSTASVRVQLEKILASAAFSHSDRLRRLLRYTVEHELEGTGSRLKEYQIGVEVFDRRDSYDPRIDPIVRVEASRLRSKLKEFYGTEGRKDSIVIDLPRGTYAPVFRERRAGPVGAGRIGAWWRRREGVRARVPAAVALLALVAIAWGLVLWRENRSLERQLQTAGRGALQAELSFLWETFIAPDARNYVVFGSPIFFASESRMLFFRWAGLNEASGFQNDAKFQEMQQRFGPLSGPRYDYALMGDARALQRLTAFFGRAGARLTALPAHEATWEDIRGGNVIFLGAPRMIPLLRRLPVQQDFDWDEDHNVVNRSPLPGEQDRYVTASHYDEVSYAVIALFPGLRRGQETLLLTAHSAPGALAAVDYVTQPATVRDLLRRLGTGTGGKRKHFQTLLRIIVDKGAPVKSEYVTHHPVSAPPAGR